MKDKSKSNIQGIQEAYNIWSAQYDTDSNKTRDLEGRALKENLEKYSFSHSLEVGCGTGKNTGWLTTISDKITAIDLSEGMLSKAREKITYPKVNFERIDILRPWPFVKEKFDLITFSLVLEHIEDLNFIFGQATENLKDQGMIYVGELHPYKQYKGSKARFETAEGIHTLTCFSHHLSEYTQQARLHHLIF